MQGNVTPTPTPTLTPNDPLSRVATALREQVSPVPPSRGGRTPGGRNSSAKKTPIRFQLQQKQQHHQQQQLSSLQHRRRDSNDGVNSNSGNDNDDFVSPYASTIEKRPRVLFSNERTIVENDGTFNTCSSNHRESKIKTPSSLSKHCDDIIYASSKSSLAKNKPRNTLIHTPTPTRRPLFSPTLSQPNTNERNLINKFDLEYKQSIREEEIGAQARQESVRNIMIFTVLLFALYLILGCLYYSIWDDESQWPLEETLIFLIYTVTTVGYGNHDIPTSPTSRVCTMLFILIGIALVTVFFSEIFQYIIINAARAQYIHDEEKITMRGFNTIKESTSSSSQNPQQSSDIEEGRVMYDIVHEVNHTDSIGVESQQQQSRIQMLYSNGRRKGHALRDVVFGAYSNMKMYLNNTKLGRYLMISFPFLFLLVLGSVVVGCIEGWSAIDSLYWAVVTLTTVGYGDLSPSKSESIWFCIFYLPTATIFLSLFLSHVASAYIQLHIAHVIRIERKLRKKYDMDEVDDSVMDLKENPSGETEGSSPELHSESTKITTPSQDRRSLKPMVSMKDLMSTAQKVDRKKSIPQDVASTPSLSLRTRVQERLASIVSIEFCKEEPKVEIKGSDVALTFLKWKEVTDTWMIPKKAKGAFKAVSCEIILSIGTNALRERGTNALFDLDSNEFQRLFNPFTVAMGSTECMEAWMLSTELLIEKRKHS